MEQKEKNSDRLFGVDLGCTSNSVTKNIGIDLGPSDLSATVQVLNFTVFKVYPKSEQFKLLEEIAQSVEADEMPLKSYLITHPKARLSVPEKLIIATWARKTMDEINHLRGP